VLSTHSGIDCRFTREDQEELGTRVEDANEEQGKRLSRSSPSLYQRRTRLALFLYALCIPYSHSLPLTVLPSLPSILISPISHLLFLAAHASLLLE
jgi:hypothetical protein